MNKTGCGSILLQKEELKMPQVLVNFRIDAEDKKGWRKRARNSV